MEYFTIAFMRATSKIMSTQRMPKEATQLNTLTRSPGDIYKSLLFKNLADIEDIFVLIAFIRLILWVESV
jgi:hypothetical protein